MGRGKRISFAEEVSARFEFLVQEFGAVGPVASNWLAPSVEYDGSGFDYSITLDEGNVIVSVSRPTPENSSYVAADLREVVAAAGLAPRQAVQISARTTQALLKSLDSQAHWVRIAHPLVMGEGGVDLLRRAR